MIAPASQSSWLDDFRTPKFVVAMAAVLVFAWAYAANVGDETMKGAIIGGFNLALGFYLGSNSSAERATINTGKAFDAVTAAAQATPAVSDAIKEGDTVVMEKQP